MVRILAAALMLLGAGPAFADSFTPAPLKTGKPVSIQGYGRQNPACREWTDGCVLCVTRDGRSSCSTPGIACVPAGLTCKAITR